MDGERDSTRALDLLAALHDVLEDGRDRLERTAGPPLVEAGAGLTEDERHSYRRRLTRLDAQVALAEATGDLPRLVATVAERDALFAALRRALESSGVRSR